MMIITCMIRSCRSAPCSQHGQTCSLYDCCQLYATILMILLFFIEKLCLIQLLTNIKMYERL